jgi:hypothetical protein
MAIYNCNGLFNILTILLLHTPLGSILPFQCITFDNNSVPLDLGNTGGDQVAGGMYSSFIMSCFT